MTIQYYIKKPFKQDFEQNAKLLYACFADAVQTSLPTVLHSHHDRLELVYISEGQGLHRIGNGLYHTKANDLLIFNNNVLHDECANPNTGMSIYTCAVKNINLSDMRENEIISDNFEPILHCSDQGKIIKNIFEGMIGQLANDCCDADNICQYLLSALLLVITRQVPKTRKAFSLRESELVIRIKQYIDDHYLEALTLDGLSEKLNMSDSYLSHKFKNFTGFAPMEYIIRRRIGKAQSLLISTDKSITAIAAEVGYENNSYFNTLFKKMVRKTPLDYRRYYVGIEQYNKLNRLSKF
ncbi:AraC family transcriptional regulator [Pectinatus haikarae]|uniref:AraC family transcriptional regulator n=1 Tax=Pectinatus haikarae TaxID=349096 RepID=UPI0018C69FA4|nr:AraC family transcriptional regulator [Pectinatus haikarae]